ncbi:restriction endonuclease [Bifidobacterium stellenboschense]|uniref:Restriction endonuclease n=2 Tax=Bifidobacterium stellenboschense TaxID=762211 RepID=A0A087DJJ6_9BIFI|nr:restriction endonuclease [Bifidobacterium stellenboschense]
MLLNRRQRNNKSAPEIARLSEGLHRTSGAVYMKLMNLRTYDPNEHAQGIAGLRHGSQYEPRIWEEYLAQNDSLLATALHYYAEFLKGTQPILEPRTQTLSIVEDVTSTFIAEFTSHGTQSQPLGSERETITLTRVNQNYFRNSLVANYNDSCCLTGISLEPLLVASHIKPWKDSTGFEKTNAANGLLLNAFHDKAFDRGYMTVDDDYRVRISRQVPHTDVNEKWLYQFEGQHIVMPKVNPPSHEFLEYHHKHVFLTS